MVQNLKTTKYNDSTDIPLVTDSATWSNLTKPGYCWYDNDEATYKNKYGALYNWYTVNTEKLCPKGWHVPTEYEWDDLINYYKPLRNEDDDAKFQERILALTEGQLSENIEKSKIVDTVYAEVKKYYTNTDTNKIDYLKDTTLWKSPNTGATNESGFTALPGGIRWDYGRFKGNRLQGIWWSTDTVENFPKHGSTVEMTYDDIGAYTSIDRKGQGNSVRCLKDQRSY